MGYGNLCVGIGARIFVGISRVFVGDMKYSFVGNLVILFAGLIMIAFLVCFISYAEKEPYNLCFTNN